MDERPYAEDIKNYWQTSQKAPDTWIENAKKEIEKVGGEIFASGYLDMGGQATYMLGFKINDDQFKLMWPVLQSRTGKHTAAQRQAATMLYHDVKAKCMAAKVLGARKAFFPYLMLDNGLVAADVATPELALEINHYLRLPSDTET